MTDTPFSRPILPDNVLMISCVYTGSEWTPAFQLLVDGETISQADYDAVYSDNVNVGQATLTITGKNSLRRRAERRGRRVYGLWQLQRAPQRQKLQR